MPDHNLSSLSMRWGAILSLSGGWFGSLKARLRFLSRIELVKCTSSQRKSHLSCHPFPSISYANWSELVPAYRAFRLHGKRSRHAGYSLAFFQPSIVYLVHSTPQCAAANFHASLVQKLFWMTANLIAPEPLARVALVEWFSARASKNEMVHLFKSSGFEWRRTHVFYWLLDWIAGLITR